MKRSVALKYSLFTFTIILIGMQFIPSPCNCGEAEGPQDVSHVVAVTPEVKGILEIACYDCHSDHTRYPWYARINPVGLLLSRHIVHGKEALNFSNLSMLSKRRLKHKLQSIAEQVETGEMPLPSYLWLHPQSRLSEADIKMIKAWSVNALKSSSE